MNFLILSIITIFGLVFEDSQRVYNEFPVYHGSICLGSSEFIMNGGKATISIFESRGNSTAIKSYIITNQTKNGWRLVNSQQSSLSFSKGEMNMKVQVIENKRNKKTKIIFYKGKNKQLTDYSLNELKDFYDIPKYPGAKRTLFIKRLTGSPHSTTIIYETLDSADSVISFYRSNMNKWEYVKFDGYNDSKLLYFNSVKSWCIISAKQNKEKTILIIVRYEK